MSDLPAAELDPDPNVGKVFSDVACSMCERTYAFNKHQLVQNVDGSTAWSVEDVVVLFVNEAGNDYVPRFFCKNLCASEWGRVNGYRLTRPSTFPARYYEAIEEEPDPQLRAIVKDQQQTDQVAKMPRSRLA